MVKSSGFQLISVLPRWGGGRGQTLTTFPPAFVVGVFKLLKYFYYSPRAIRIVGVSNLESSVLSQTRTTNQQLIVDLKLLYVSKVRSHRTVLKL